MSKLNLTPTQVEKFTKLEKQLVRTEANTQKLALDYGREMIAAGVTDRSLVSAFRAETGITRSPRLLWSYVLAVQVLPDKPEYAKVNYTSRSKLVTAHAAPEEAARLIDSLPKDERNGAPLTAAVREFQAKQHSIGCNPTMSMQRPVSLFGERYVPGSNESWYTVNRMGESKRRVTLTVSVEGERDTKLSVPVGSKLRLK